MSPRLSYRDVRSHHRTQNPSGTQLRIFADASMKAYGAVAYLCNGSETSMVMAKSRVAPLKKLMAALTGARLGNFANKR